MKCDLSYIVYEVTTECNQQCQYCYNIWNRPNQKYKKLNSYSQALKTLKRIFKQANINDIVFSGGEPLLAERFNELVLYAKLKKAYVNVISNGTAVDFKEYETLIKLRVDHFQIPLLSIDPQIHDLITQHNGSWEKAVSTIKQLIKNHAEVVAVIIITKQNIPTIRQTIEYIAGLGIKDVMLNRYSIGGRGLCFGKEIIPAKEELNEAYRIANGLSKKLNLSITSNVCTPHCILNPTDFDNIGFVECSSTQFDKPLTIDIEGNVRICNHSPSILGNIYNDELKDIINSNRVTDWYKKVPVYCENCSDFKKCQGGCRGASEQLGFSIMKEDPIIEIMNCQTDVNL